MEVTPLVAVEVAICIAGQGIRRHGQGAHNLRGPGEFVHRHQLVIGNAIDFSVGGVISHIRQNHTQIGNLSGIGQIILRHNVQVTCLGRGQHIVVYNGRRIEGLAGIGIGLQIVRGGLLGYAGPIPGVQIEGNHAGQRLRLANLHVHLIGGGVSGIVHDLEEEALAVDTSQIQGILRLFARLDILLRPVIGQDLGTRQIIQGHSSHILIVAGRHLNGVPGEAQRGVLHHRSRVVHHHGNPEGGAFAQSIPIHHSFALCIVRDIILRSHGQCELQTVTLCSALGEELRIEAVVGIHPVAAIGEVEGRCNSALLRLHDDPVFRQVFGGDTSSCSISDEHKLKLRNLVAILAVDGVALRQIAFIGHNGVAAKIGGLRAFPISHNCSIALHVSQIRSPSFLPRQILHAGAHIEHGSIRPVAVEAQNRDGVGSAHCAVICGHTFDKYIALNVSAIGIILVQGSLLLLRQDCCNLHVDRTAGRNRDRIACAECHLSVETGGPGVHVGDPLIRKQILGKEIPRQSVGLLRLCQVENGEGELVAAGLFRVVAQLRLDFAIGIGLRGVLAHENVAVRRDRRAHIGKAGALAQDGIVAVTQVIAFRILAKVLQLRHSRGHEQALSQLTGGVAGLFLQPRLTDVLSNQSSHTGHLRSGHRGAGHVLIALAAGNNSIHGVDVAAGGGNLRLQLQRAGNAPGGEAAHGIVLLRPNLRADLHLYRQLAFIVENLACLVGHRNGVGLHQGAILLSHGDAGLGVLIVRQVHVDGASRVIIDNRGDSSSLNGVITLLEEGDGATGANCNGPLQSIAHGGPLRFRTEAVNEDISLFSGDGGERLVHILVALGVEHRMLAHGQVLASGACIVD